MHLTREIMLKNSFNGPSCFLRPTLIYGNDDPHNGYGPNRFIRLAKENKIISLFGAGEELRDHVWIDDVAEIVLRVILNKSIGTINIATGKILSFFEIAKIAIISTNSRSKIKKTKRMGPIPHNGYRSFNINYIKKKFSNFKYKRVSEVLKRIERFY